MLKRCKKKKIFKRRKDCTTNSSQDGDSESNWEERLSSPSITLSFTFTFFIFNEDSPLMSLFFLISLRTLFVKNSSSSSSFLLIFVSRSCVSRMEVSQEMQVLKKPSDVPLMHFVAFNDSSLIERVAWILSHQTRVFTRLRTQAGVSLINNNQRERHDKMISPKKRHHIENKNREQGIRGHPRHEKTLKRTVSRISLRKYLWSERLNLKSHSSYSSALYALNEGGKGCLLQCFVSIVYQNDQDFARWIRGWIILFYSNEIKPEINLLVFGVGETRTSRQCFVQILRQAIRDWVQ